MESDQIKKLQQWVISQSEFSLLLTIGRELGVDIFLVGGLVRDRLLKMETKDVDLTLSGQALKAAKIFADRIKGTFVLLREKEEMARVVMPDRTFDFAAFRGTDLEADLRGRDFTINAISLPLAQAFSQGDWVPYDPLNGTKDLQDRVLRMTAPDCFQQDPLRMLRTFRLSAQLGLTIDPDTLEAIKQLAPILTQSAPERIHYEWMTWLLQPVSFHAIQEMEEVGLFKVLFPEMALLKKINQDRHHHLNAYEHSLLALQCLEELIQGRIPLPKNLETEKNVYLKETNKAAWLKWAALMHDLGKASTGDEKQGHKTFYGHAEVSKQQFALIASRYRLSNHEKTCMDRMIGLHMRPLYLIQEDYKNTLTQRALIRFVREAGEELTGILMLALTDSLAAQGKEKPKDLEDRLKDLWRRAISVRDKIIRPLEGSPPLVSGKDLIELGLTPGPLFRTVLSEIQEAQLEGKISSREEALAWIKKEWASD